MFYLPLCISDLSADVVTQRVRDVLINLASKANELPTPLCDKPAADKVAAISVSETNTFLFHSIGKQSDLNSYRSCL
jgi:hypothetical protein